MPLFIISTIVVLYTLRLGLCHRGTLLRTRSNLLWLLALWAAQGLTAYMRPSQQTFNDVTLDYLSQVFFLVSVLRAAVAIETRVRGTG